jgi:hypothetical protein
MNADKSPHELGAEPLDSVGLSRALALLVFAAKKTSLHSVQCTSTLGESRRVLNPHVRS